MKLLGIKSLVFLLLVSFLSFILFFIILFLTRSQTKIDVWGVLILVVVMGSIVALIWDFFGIIKIIEREKNEKPEMHRDIQDKNIR